MRICALAACLVTACNSGQGSLELDLSLPMDPALRPSGMTTVTVTATFPGESPIATTSVIDNGTFTAGDVPVGQDAQIGVVLRDVSNRIVGVGEAGQTIDIVGDQATQITIPVRKPFVYASGAAPLVTYDPTLDPRDDGFQSTMPGVASGLFTVSVGGDRAAIVTATQVLVVATDANTVTGMIGIPSMPRDATAVPGTHKIAVAHATGITIVDLDTMTVATAPVGAVDKVTAGPAENGTMYAYGLIGRVTPPELPPPMGTCSGSSSIVAIEVDNPTVHTPKSVTMAVSDIAAAPDTTALFASLPCAGRVARVTGDPTLEVGDLTLEEIATVQRAAVLAVAGNRIWAAGTQVAEAECSSTNGDCATTSTVSCTGGTANDVVYVDQGASIIVSSIPIDDTSQPITFVAPPRRETIIDSRDDAMQHAQLLKAISAVPVDLVTLPGGQYVSLITKSRYFIVTLRNIITGEVILPCLDAETHDWMLFDLASSAVSQRVRTFCSVIVQPMTGQFPMWACDQPPDAELSETEYKPTSVGALFGVR
jgi:hypothetical protein